MDAILQFLATGVMVGGIYGLIALSIVLIFKATGIFNFAVGQFVMIGGYIFYALSVQLGLNAWISFPIALIVACALGALANRFTLQPLIGQPVGTQMMVTLALVSLINGITLVIWGGNIQKVPNLLPGDIVRIGNTTFSTVLIGAFAVAFIVIAVFALFFQKSRTGLAMRATAESHMIAQARGINVKLIFTLTWALSALIAAIAGIFVGIKVGVAIPSGAIGLKAFSAVLFGGVDSVFGSIVGGLSVGIIETLSGGLLDPWLMEISPFIIILLILIFRPEGLFGQKRIERI